MEGSTINCTDARGKQGDPQVHNTHRQILALSQEMTGYKNPTIPIVLTSCFWRRTSGILEFCNVFTDSLVVECWLRVREVPGSIPSQGPRHTKDIIQMVPVVPLFST